MNAVPTTLLARAPSAVVQERALQFPTLREHQATAYTRIVEQAVSGVRRLIVMAPCSFGKCLHPDTEIIMADGSVRRIDDIHVGDRVLGDDGQIRNVIGRTDGMSQLHRIKPRQKGHDEWICNDKHILSIHCKSNTVRGKTGGVIDVGIDEWLQWSAHDRGYSRQFAVGFDGWDSVNWPYDPYMVGLWLGDGTLRNTDVTNPDIEVGQYIEQFAQANGLTYRHRTPSNRCESHGLVTVGQRCNPFREFLHENFIGADGEKCIPINFIASSREQRLALLAGLIDTDGYLMPNGNCYEIAQRRGSLSDAIALLARSLGCKVAISEKCVNGTTYDRMHLTGDLRDAPIRIARKKQQRVVTARAHGLIGFDVEDAGFGRYVGIAVDGNQRFLKSDFVVVHNTVLAAHLACKASEKHKRFLFLVDNLELVGQTLETFDACGLRVGVMQGQHERYDLSAPVQIATNQTITKRIAKYPQYFESTPFHVVVVDEAHCRYKALQEVADLYPSAMFVGLTATPWARGMGKFWETIVPTITVPELLDMGWLAPVDVYSHPCPSWAKIKVQGGDYVLSDAAKEYTPHLIADVVGTWEKTCADLSTLVFACDRAHARAMASEFQAAGYNFVVVDGATDATERRELIAGFKSGEIQGLSTCQVAIKGFNATIAGCMVDVQPTKSLLRHYQKIGRIQRIHEGKERSIALDFAGNFIRNGLPTDVLPTTLNDGDPTSTSNDTRNNDNEAPLPVSCSNCSMLRPRGVTKCPNCGYQPTPMQEREHEEGMLEILTGDPRQADRIPDSEATKERWHRQMLEYAYRQGYKPGWARHAYRERFKEEPRSATKSTQISADVMQWCENYRRRKARAYIAQLKQEGKLEERV